MTEALVSIALCTYNGERFLREQVDSLLQQSWQHLEIVVCDDGSTDGTIAILKAYAEKDTRIKLYCNPQNLRLTRNFEKAIGLCTGHYLMLCDQDDIWEKDKVAKLMAAIGEDLLVYADSALVDEQGKYMGTRISSLRRMYTGNDTRGFVLSNCVWGHTVLFRRVLVQHILPIPAGIPHDNWIAFAATSVQRIRYIEEVLTHYRQHSHTVTSTLPVKGGSAVANRNRKEYMDRMAWLLATRDFPQNNNPGFYHRLYALYARKANGRFVWPLFFFLLKHRKALFAFTRKSLLSQVNELRKQARGVA